MEMTITVTVDGETGTYLQQLAADQGRTPEDVAAWILTDEVRRERSIDAEIITRMDSPGERASA